MSIQEYLQAATPDNTRRAYRNAIKHFEVTWGGMLPTTANQVTQYLDEYSKIHSHATLRLRLSALSRWHKDQGFHDPTQSPLVRSVMRGIKKTHPYQQKKAKPLAFSELEQLDSWFESAITKARDTGDPALGSLLRDRALVLLGFWRALRSDDLCRLRIEFIETAPEAGFRIFQPQSKGDRDSEGRVMTVQSLRRCCPVSACQQWMDYLGERTGPLFRGFDRWGNPRSNHMNSKSVNRLLRSIFDRAGIASADSYSSHSLRRGFANWAAREAMDLKTLMEYVGWQDPRTALEYIDAQTPSFDQVLERIDVPHATLPAKEVRPPFLGERSLKD